MLSYEVLRLSHGSQFTRAMELWRQVPRLFLKRNRFASVPIVVLTSSSSSRERAQIEDLGITRHITKPHDLDEFMKIGFELKELLK